MLGASVQSGDAMGSFGRITSVKELPAKKTLVSYVRKAMALNEAGIKKAVAVLADDLEDSQFLYSPQSNLRRHNNPSEFANIALGDEVVDVVCSSYEDASGKRTERYGLCDEQARLNINTVDRETLARLMLDVLSLTTDGAKKLAESVVDWRDYGRHEAEGFFSDDYYANLEHPYQMKERDFERMDELLLVKGFNGGIYEKLYPYLTVYGDGRINVNTVSRKVLLALGIDPVLADKVLKARSGPDGLDTTADDHVFYRSFDIASEVNALVPLEEKEARQFDDLNARNMLTTSSMVYSAMSRVHSSTEDPKRTIRIVFNALTNKIEYWHEK